MKNIYKQYKSEYKSWIAMKQRCLNPHDNRYHKYGEIGITVCERWCNSFINFLDDMGRKPITGWHIHRINGEGDYNPGNCIWVDPQEHRKIPHSARYVMV